MYKVVEEKIIKYAQDCYYDDICQDDKITLKFLYDNYHLEKITDPVTKEYYNENSFVQRENLNFTFVRVP